MRRHVSANVRSYYEWLCQRGSDELGKDPSLRGLSNEKVNLNIGGNVFD